jgi:hypothetical protein
VVRVGNMAVGEEGQENRAMVLAGWVPRAARRGEMSRTR